MRLYAQPAFRVALVALAALAAFAFNPSHAGAQNAPNCKNAAGVGVACTPVIIAGPTGVYYDPANPPIPAGGATAAKQDTGNASLGSIDTKLTSQATAANQTTANTKLDTLHADLTAATPAGENHVGEVGGNTFPVVVAQTVTASSAYAAGNAVGGLITVAAAKRVSGAPGAHLQSVVINMKSAQTAAVDVVIFNANPTGSTCTDKTAFAVAAADFNKVVGVAHVTDWTSLGTPSVGQSQNLAMPFDLSGATTAYACVVTRGTPTFTATSDPSVTFMFERN